MSERNGPGVILPKATGELYRWAGHAKPTPWPPQASTLLFLVRTTGMRVGKVLRLRTVPVGPLTNDWLRIGRSAHQRSGK